MNRLNHHFKNRLHKSKTILLVDDEKDLGWSLRKIVQDSGHRFIFAPTLKVGLQKFMRSKGLDMAIVDLMLRNESGLKFIERAKKISKRVEFVMISAFGDSELKSEARQLGVQHFLDKPFKVEKLLEIINHESAGVKNSKGENK